jgi:hypothetical protein
MVRKILGLFSSSGDQQEQPFAQVNANHSSWIKGNYSGLCLEWWT